MRALSLALLLLASPAYAEPICMVIYANDINDDVTAEIAAHELAHCNGWIHPSGWDPERSASLGHDAAYLPPAKYVRPFNGRLIDHSVSSEEATFLCDELMGIATIGCSVLHPQPEHIDLVERELALARQ